MTHAELLDLAESLEWSCIYDAPFRFLQMDITMNGVNYNFVA
jgi:hypothetical protein